ncbi:MAG: hypothetical protein Q9193_006242 [Seirophora villosa]
MSGHHDNEIDIDGEQGLRRQFATLIGTMQPRVAAPTREDKEDQARARPEDMESKQLVVTEGLEPAYQDNHAGATDGLEPVHIDMQPVAFSGASPEHVQDPSFGPPRRRRRRRWAFASCIAIVLLAIAIAVPLGVILSKNKTQSRIPEGNATTLGSTVTATASEPTATPNGSSRSALRGTRLAKLNSQTNDETFLFYQRSDGSLHYSSLNSARVWQGSMDVNIQNAKLGTPLCAIDTTTNGSVLWWLFYVDQLNVIQNAYSKHDPTSWKLGNIGEKGYKVPSSPPSIAFTVSPGRKYNNTLVDIDGGLSLFSGTETGSIQEYIYDDGDGTWSDGYTFSDTDGSRGASVFSQQSDALLFATNNDHDIMFWSQRYHSTATTQWKRGPTSSYLLASNGSMCGAFDFVFESPKGRIQGSNFPSQIDLIHRTFGTTYEIGNSNMLDGSALSCQFFSSEKPTFTRFHVFYQVESNDIMEARNYWAPDEGEGDMPENWSYKKVPTD